MHQRLLGLDDGIEQRDPALAITQQLPDYPTVAGITDRAEGTRAPTGTPEQ
ncbi:hypothetical protein ACIRBZ_28855 [Streptomyces sp. NPDC094038]|uniref:hypothetical protein n=1 Tax=Streptomyces sp. NPDC094038 TaxID=3366055 RepID=UPI0037F154A7